MLATKSETASAKSGSELSETESSVLEVLKSMRQEIKDNIMESRKCFSSIGSAITDVKESIEKFVKRFEVLEDEKAELKKRCDKLEERAADSQRKLRVQNKDILELQQDSRRDNIEIKGVPHSSKENVYVILEHVARALQIQFHRGEVSTAHRLPPPEKLPAEKLSDTSVLQHPAIIVKFISRTTREMWLCAARGKRLTASDISPHLSQGPVFINCHLIPYNKYLLGLAKEAVRDKKLGAAWSKDDGKILVKKAKNDKPRRVSTEDELLRVLSNW